jgi:hypothetical protein
VPTTTFAPTAGLPPTSTVATDFADPDVVLNGSTNDVAFGTHAAFGNGGIQAQPISCTNGAGNCVSAGGNYTALTLSAANEPWAITNDPVGNGLNAPAVFFYAGRYVMFYDAAESGGSHYRCIGVATSGTLTGVFTGAPSPIVCNDALYGAIDASTFVDHHTGVAYLMWKTSNVANDGVLAQIWSQQLNATGTGLVGAATVLLTQRSGSDATIEAPDMVWGGDAYYLFFAGGAGTYNSSAYQELYAVCKSAVGPCTRPSSDVLLGSGGTNGEWGPGSASVFTSTSGQTWIGYSAWPTATGDCYGFTGCDNTRYMYTTPLTIPKDIVGMAPTPSNKGYWEVTSAGVVYPEGNAVSYGSMAGYGLNEPIVGIAATHDGKGYWLVASDGGIFAFGDAAYEGSEGGKSLNAPIVGMAADKTGNGYWLVASDGGIFAFGDAPFEGSEGGKTLNAPIVGIAGDVATGTGYWLVGADGGIFAFNCPFEGSEGGKTLNAPIVGIAGDVATGTGYWLVGADGGIFAFNCPFEGSEGGKTLNAPMVGISANAAGTGYWLVGADGGIFAFNVGYHGSEGPDPLNASITAIAGTSDAAGYWMLGSDGGIFAFGDATMVGVPGYS